MQLLSKIPRLWLFHPSADSDGKVRQHWFGVSSTASTMGETSNSPCIYHTSQEFIILSPVPILHAGVPC